jgi:hypothetical protein
MNQVRAAALEPKAVSAGMLWLVGTAIVLTQLASLALGSGADRQLNVSLAVPAVDLEEVSSSVGSQVDAVLGAIVTAGPVGTRQTGVAAPLTSSPVLLTVGRSVPILQANVPVKNSPVAIATEPSVTAGHSRHDERGHGRGLARVRLPIAH